MAKSDGVTSQMLRLLWLLPLIIFSASNVVGTQENETPPSLNFHRWGSITVFNGLPSDSVRAIAQTPDGVMWFGTDNGLARFDGRRVQNFTLGDGDANRILTMKTDASGQLWIGTQKGAFVGSVSGFRPIDGTQDVAVFCFLLGDQILLGTNDGFVMGVKSREDGSRLADRFQAEQLVDSENKPVTVTTLLKDIHNRLFVGTAGKGLLEIKDGRFSALSLGPSPPNINAAVDAKDANIWFARDAQKGKSGIYSIDSSSRTKIAPAPTATVFALEIDNYTGIWAGTARYGLFHFEDGALTESFTFENTSGGLRSNTIFSLFNDREGVLWIGTNRGVSRYDPEGPLQETVSDIPNSNFVRTLFHYGENYPLFAGTNRGLFEIKGEKWERIAGLGDRPIYAIYSLGPKDDVIIAATPQGLFDSKGILILKGDVRSINYFEGRTFAAVYGSGVFDVTDRRVPKLVFSNDSVTALGGYRQKMWIGTAGNGLFSYDGEKAKLEIPPETLKSGTIWTVGGRDDQALLEGREEVMMAAQHGVFIVRDGIPEQLLAAEDVRDFLGTSDDFFAATTSRGLIHVKRDLQFGVLVNSIGFEQGLPSEKTFSMLPTHEGILVATNRGVVTIQAHRTNPKIIPIRILSQRVHDVNEIGSTIALDYPQNSLLVEVAGQSSRTFPEEFQYAFELKNSKGDVVDQKFSNDPQYNPTELKPGEYTVEAIAFDRDLNRSEPLLIKFSIAKAPFPWTATALGVLLAIALIGLVWAIVEHRRIRQRNRELAAARFDLANEAERERSRIARDLHDQTLADLRHLMMKSDKGDLDAQALRTEIESVSTEVRRICEDLSPSVLENVGLIPALDFLLTNTFENRSFEAADGIDEKIAFPINVQLQIYRIAQEVLTNIRKHSDAQSVEMRVESSDDGEFQLKILDDGTAFEPNVNGSGRGISNIRSRANLISSKVAWKRRRSGGNAFTLRVAK